MLPVFRPALVPLLAALLVVPLTALVDTHRADVEAWRKKHEADYRREYVSLAGLFFLSPGANSAGSAATNAVVLPASVPASIGAFVLDKAENGAVRFEPAAGADVTLKGARVTAPVTLTSDEQDHPDELESGGVTFWLHESGARRAIRLRDEHSEIARAFAGFRWFPIKSRYRVTGHFIKDPAPHQVHTPNLSGDDNTFDTEGVVSFTLNGRALRLRPVTTRPKRFWFIFRDGTSGKETYETARFLYADLQDDGDVVLDFNEAYNPPCAFNPYTTCPLPPPENRLTARILAGERAYAAPHAATPH